MYIDDMISKEQITDAVGQFGEIGAAEVQPDQLKAVGDFHVTPGYAAIRAAIDPESSATRLALNNEKMNAARAQLKALGGARVVVAQMVRVGSEVKQLFAPGVVLDDGRPELRFGILTTPGVDRTEEYKDKLQFSPIQQSYLAQMYFSSRPEVGAHGGVAKVADVGHGQLIAVSNQPDSLHTNVHAFAETGQLGSRVASKLSIQSGHKTRPISSEEVGSNQVSALIITEQQQTPFPMSGRAFDLSAGLAMAVRRTQTVDAPRQFNDQLKRNFAAMNGETC